MAEPGSQIESSKRPWAVRAVGWLLLLQATLLVTLIIWQILEASEDLTTLPETAVFTYIIGILAGSLALAAVVILIGFTLLAYARLWTQGWGYAMLVQGLLLAITLVHHYRGPDFYVYPLMLFSIFMVIYLHHPEIQDTFQVRVLPVEENQDLEELADG